MHLTNKLTTYTAALLLACALFLATVQPAAAFTANQNTQIASALSALRTTLEAFFAPEGAVLGVSTINVSNSSELAAALNSATGGETIVLSSGNYGAVPSMKQYASTVTVKSANTSNPATFSSMLLNGAKNVTFDGIKFDYVYSSGDKQTIAPFTIGSSNIVLQNGVIDGDDDSGGHPTGHGLYIRGGSNVTVKNMDIVTWHRGVKLYQTENIKLLNNDVSDISGDALKISETEGALLEGNYLHDFRADPASATHRDMIQIFTLGNSKPSTNITIRDNVFDIKDGSWTQTIFMRNEEVDQGKQSFEKMAYRNFLIEGNTITNLHTHGITLGEADGVVVRNNKLTAASRNTNDAVNQAHLQKYTSKSAVYIPSIRMSEGSKNVTIEGNNFYGASQYYSGERIYGYTGQSGWIVRNNEINGDEVPETSTPVVEEDIIPMEEEPVEEEKEPVVVEPDEPEVVEEEVVTGTSIVDAGDIISDSGNFSSAHPPHNLLDGCITTAEGCSAGTNQAESFWVEFDLGQPYDLSKARIFGDTNGTWHSRTWTLATKQNKSDGYQYAFSGSSVYGNQWYSKNINKTARYVKLTVAGTPGSGKVQAVEFSLEGSKSMVQETEKEEEESVVEEKEEEVEEVDVEESSPEITSDTRVRTTDNLNVRATPNGVKVGSQNKGSLGIITNDKRTTVAGHDWVYVDFDTSPDGYVADTFITAALSNNVSVSDQQSIFIFIQSLLQQLKAIQTLYDQLYGS